ncbi:MarR family transcriptional regulator [Verrucomicrobiaceae bacterium R5-34]|nr:MarR family transcriptional regulator [Verrucomicrobiaceae bacterium R5-34]
MIINQHDSPGFAIGRTNYLFRLRIIEALRLSKSQLNPEEAWILMVLKEADRPLPGSEFNDFMMRDASTLTRQLNGLAGKGMIERQRDPNDGRAVTIHLTRQGKAELKKLEPHAADIRTRAAAGIDPNDYAVMIDCLMKIQKNLASPAKKKTGTKTN